MDIKTFELVVLLWIGLAIVTLLILVFTKIRAPYGRHSSSSWGKMIDNKLGWFLMELNALCVFPVMVLFGTRDIDALTWLLLGLWTLHYFHRSVIFPFRLRTKGKKMPWTIVLSAISFNAVNGFLNGLWLGFLAPAYEHFFTPTTLAGLVIFAIGMYINLSADTKLINLRKSSEGYQIPKGGLFEYITCPNHFGEILEWTGFAIIAWNLPALSFAVWTFCNLLPRALNHHVWYKEHLEDYPENRKAVIPGIL